MDDVHDVLVDMLMNHSFEPGERLNIDALARTLGVSPTPIREALARMEAEGLVVRGPRRSYTVAPLISLDDLRALIDFRLLIEPAAAAAAARNASTEEAEALARLRPQRRRGRLRRHGQPPRHDLRRGLPRHDRRP